MKQKPTQIYNSIYLEPLTVSELKRVLNDWPETRNNGEPTEVWIGHQRFMSCEVHEIWSLDSDGFSADILLASSHKPAPESCKTCYFFEPNGIDSVGIPHMECRRYAPHIISGVGTGYSEQQFPYTKESSWCGEYKVK